MNKETRYEVKRKQNTLLVNLDHIYFATYDRVLFHELSLNVKGGEIIALTGKSGSGKTLLLKIIAGMEYPLKGRVNISPSIITSFVPQEIGDIEIDKNSTIKQVLKDVKGLTQIEEEMKKIEKKMSIDLINSQVDIERYGELMEHYIALKGYDQETEMLRLFSGLKIDEHLTKSITLDTKLSQLSSGQLKKIMIARALYINPDLLLLDDPTSHLDTSAVSWLGNYLKGITSAVIITSNNREFLDICTTQTVGLTDSGRVFSFDGNYSDFISKRDAVVEAEKSEANSISNQLEDLQETDKMFREKQVYRNSSNMAQVGRALKTRIKKLEEKYKLMPGSQDIDGQENFRNLVFTQETISGKDVILINKVVKKYGNYIALDFTDCEPICVTQGKKWLVYGPNGSGKSTLLKIIAQKVLGGNFVPDEGNITTGTNVNCAYYSADFDSLSTTGSILEELTSKIGINDSRIAASVLRFFGFTPSAILNLDIRMLSSGEKKRLALAKIMLGNYNLLILDEPTGDYMPNEIKKRLAEALNGYQGTVIISSHDAYFLKKLHIDFKLDMPEGKKTFYN